MEKRRNARFNARFDALVSTGPAEGTGVLTDISYSGARLEQATVKPLLDSQVRLYVFVQPVSPFELAGRVVRHTETGFAIEYEVLDPEVRRLVDDVSALVSSPA